MELKNNSSWIDKFENDILYLYDIKSIILKKRTRCVIDKFYYDNIGKARVLHKILAELCENNFGKFVSSNMSTCHNNYIYYLAQFAWRIFYKNRFDLGLLRAIYKLYNNYYKFNDIEKKLFNLYI